MDFMFQIIDNYMSYFTDFLHQFNFITIVLRLILAIIAGGVIGNERGRHGSAAGLRTHILVCVGSAMTALTGYFTSYILGFGGDVLRLAAQVVSGIGFLGAGMIIVKNSNVVTGLTTAAGMWATAAIGIALGYGFYSGAIVATIFCVFTTAFLTRLERKRKKAVHIYMEVAVDESLGNITEEIKEKIDSDALVESVPPKSNVPNTIGFYVTITNHNNIKINEIREQIGKFEGVRFCISE